MNIYTHTHWLTSQYLIKHSLTSKFKIKKHQKTIYKLSQLFYSKIEDGEYYIIIIYIYIYLCNLKG